MRRCPSLLLAPMLLQTLALPSCAPARARVATRALSPAATCTNAPDPRFDVLVLGAHGGLRSDDLSAYLVTEHGQTDAVCLDAGSLYTGLERAATLGTLKVAPRVALREQIRGYLISHPHLDHLAGLVLASPDDAPNKFIGGSEPTLTAMQTHLFNGSIWATFGSEHSPTPRIGLYTALPLTPGQPTALPDLHLTVEAWPLNHPGGASAFVLTNATGEAMLYLGDTTTDAAAGSEHLLHLWQRVAPLVRSGKLRALFIEVSYPDPRPDDRLYGHLTPKRLHAELTRLAALSHPEAPALHGLFVVITHIKPDTGDPRRQIQTQLTALPALGARYVYPLQGQRLML